MVDDGRSGWDIGTQLKIWSNSQQRWFQGQIDKMEPLDEDGIEWCTITYNNGCFEKVVDKMDEDTLQPLLEDDPDTAASPPPKKKGDGIGLDPNRSKTPVSQNPLKNLFNKNNPAFAEKDLEDDDVLISSLPIANPELRRNRLNQSGLGPSLNHGNVLASSKRLNALRRQTNNNITSARRTMANALANIDMNDPMAAADIDLATLNALLKDQPKLSLQTPGWDQSKYPVPEFQEYLVKKLQKENKQLKEAIRLERKEKQLKHDEVQELKTFINTMKDKMITESHKKNLEIDGVKAIIDEKNMKIENLQHELHIKLQERYNEVKLLRDTINHQQMHITKLENMKSKLKFHLVKHFNEEFAKRDNEILRLTKELNKNQQHIEDIISNQSSRSMVDSPMMTSPIMADPTAHNLSNSTNPKSQFNDQFSPQSPNYNLMERTSNTSPVPMQIQQQLDTLTSKLDTELSQKNQIINLLQQNLQKLQSKKDLPEEKGPKELKSIGIQTMIKEEMKNLKQDILDEIQPRKRMQSIAVAAVSNDQSPAMISSVSLQSPMMMPYAEAYSVTSPSRDSYSQISPLVVSTNVQSYPPSPPVSSPNSVGPNSDNKNINIRLTNDTKNTDNAINSNLSSPAPVSSVTGTTTTECSPTPSPLASNVREIEEYTKKMMKQYCLDKYL